MNATDTKLTEVPYDGTGPAMEDLVGSQVDFMCDQTTNTTEQITAGTVKPYAITSPERNEALPDVPTTTEAGLPDVQVSVWHGMYVPKDTPDEVVQALTAALQAALQDQNVIDQFAAARHDGRSGGPGDAGGAHGEAAGADRALAADHRGGRRDAAGKRHANRAGRPRHRPPPPGGPAPSGDRRIR